MVHPMQIKFRSASRAGIAQSVEHQALGREVLGLNLASASSPRSDIGSHSSSSLTIPMCKIGTRPSLGKSELTLRIHYTQATASDGASTLALKPMGGVNRSPKQRVPVSPQNGERKKVLKKRSLGLQIQKLKVMIHQYHCTYERPTYLNYTNFVLLPALIVDNSHVVVTDVEFLLVTFRVRVFLGHQGRHVVNRCGTKI